MKYDELSAKQCVHKLAIAGRFPDPDLIGAVWQRRSETEPLLLDTFRQAYHDDWPNETDPRWYRFVHAGKFMIAWQTIDALPIFTDLYMDDLMQDWLEWFEEKLYYFGPAAIPHLQQIVAMDSGGEWHYGRALAGSTLTRIAAYYPDTRDQITAIFRALLPSLGDLASLIEAGEMWGDIASELGELADENSRDHILALSDAGLLDRQYYSDKEYLQLMNRGFRPKPPPGPYDIREESRRAFESHQRSLRIMAEEKQKLRESRLAQAQARSGPKTGRNDPCPCGSGKKYKLCHGRPGA